MINIVMSKKRRKARMKTKLFYTVSEVSSMLGISECSIRKYLHSGKLKGMQFGKLGGRWRIPAAEIERLQKGLK